jgi:hypothetical protein
MPTKLINVPNTSPRKQKHSSRRQRKSKPRALDLDRLAHEMINQLTVIQLSCFQLRGAIARGLDSSVLVDIDRMENTVVEMTSLLECLSAQEVWAQPTSAHGAKTSERSPAKSANVYRLFKAGQTRRKF